CLVVAPGKDSRPRAGDSLTMPRLATRGPLEVSELPEDPTLPGLALLGDPSRLTATLSRPVAQWLGPDARLLGSQAHLRRLAPGKRCSVEIEMVVDRQDGGPPERRRLLGKVYREDRSVTVYETLRDLRRHGFGAGRFVVPEPVAYLPDYHLLLLSWAEGESLSSVVLGHSDVSQEIAGGAEWLLRLHNCGAGTGRRYSFAGHLQTLASWQELLTHVYPEGESLLTDLLARFATRGTELSGLTPRPTHRDFTPEHLIVHGDQFTGLDFDEFCQYDPRFD